MYRPQIRDILGERRIAGSQIAVLVVGVAQIGHQRAGGHVLVLPDGNIVLLGGLQTPFLVGISNSLRAKMSRKGKPRLDVARRGLAVVNLEGLFLSTQVNRSLVFGLCITFCHSTARLHSRQNRKHNLRISSTKLLIVANFLDWVN